MRAGDLLRLASGTRRRQLPGPRRISALEARRLFGGLRSDGLRGAILFWDGQLEDDARLVIAVARTAAAHGAAIVTHCAALDAAQRPGGGARRGDRRHLRRCARERSSTRPACGPAPSTTRCGCAPARARTSSSTPPPSATRGPRWSCRCRARARAGWGRRPPGRGRVIVGVTDDAHTGPIDDEPAVSDGEEDLPAAHALERPAAAPDRHWTCSAATPASGRCSTPAGDRPPTCRAATPSWSPPTARLVTVVGGKLTTYRRMAEDAVDRVVARHGGPPQPHRGSAAGRRRRTPDDVPGAPARLVRRYGSEAAGRGPSRRAATRRCCSPCSRAATCSASSCSSASSTRARWTSTTCSTAACASGWCRRSGGAPEGLAVQLLGGPRGVSPAGAAAAALVGVGRPRDRHPAGPGRPAPRRAAASTPPRPRGATVTAAGPAGQRARGRRAARRAARRCAAPTRSRSSDEARLRHAAGRSYLDLLALRGGRLEAAPDAVVSPASEAEVASRPAPLRRARRARWCPSVAGPRWSAACARCAAATARWSRSTPAGWTAASPSTRCR